MLTQKHQKILEDNSHPLDGPDKTSYVFRTTHAERGPKLPCTSRRMRRAFRARIFAKSSGCEVNVVSTSLGFSWKGYCRPTNQHKTMLHRSPHLREQTIYQSYISSHLTCLSDKPTHFVQILVCHQRKPELRTTANDASRSSLEERFEARFAIY